jgi:hypothetical protein
LNSACWHPLDSGHCCRHEQTGPPPLDCAHLSRQSKSAVEQLDITGVQCALRQLLHAVVPPFLSVSVCAHACASVDGVGTIGFGSDACDEAMLRGSTQTNMSTVSLVGTSNASAHIVVPAGASD